MTIEWFRKQTRGKLVFIDDFGGRHEEGTIRTDFSNKYFRIGDKGTFIEFDDLRNITIDKLNSYIRFKTVYGITGIVLL